MLRRNNNSLILTLRYGDHSVLCRRSLTGNDVMHPCDVMSASWPTSTRVLPVCCTTWPETGLICESYHGDQAPPHDVIVEPETEVPEVVEVAGSRRYFFTMNVLGIATARGVRTTKLSLQGPRIREHLTVSRSLANATLSLQFRNLTYNSLYHHPLRADAQLNWTPSRVDLGLYMYTVWWHKQLDTGVRCCWCVVH